MSEQKLGTRSDNDDAELLQRRILEVESQDLEKRDAQSNLRRRGLL
jgi:hypothetical protein